MPVFAQARGRWILVPLLKLMSPLDGGPLPTDGSRTAVPAGGCTAHQGGTMDDAELDAQMEDARDAVRAAVLRLLRDGDVDPRLVLPALAQVAGEVGASTALTDGKDVEDLLDALAEAVRRSGREFREMLEAGARPPNGSV
jgi:hypothetical protein